MAISLTGAQNNLVGLSTDEKPQDALINTLFLELDTGNFYFYNGSTWQKLGA